MMVHSYTQKSELKLQRIRTKIAWSGAVQKIAGNEKRKILLKQNATQFKKETKHSNLGEKLLL